MRFINYLAYVLTVAFISIFFTGVIVEVARQIFEFGYYRFFDVAMGFAVAVFAGIMNYCWPMEKKVLTIRHLSMAVANSIIMVAIFAAGVYILRLTGIAGHTAPMDPVIAWAILPYFIMEVATAYEWIMREEDELA